MSSTIGNVHDLNASRAEALHGLLRSLGHTIGNDDTHPGTSATERLQKLSQKVGEILGDGKYHDSTPGGQPCQLLNEEGLPVIDITEPVNEDSQPSMSSPPVSEHDLIPLSLLTVDERRWRRRERERILDLLEEEECLQQIKEEQKAEDGRKEAIRNRKESAMAELEKFKAARALQKKMGQALVRQDKEARENEQKEEARSKPQTTPVAKKSVSFADISGLATDERDQKSSIYQHAWSDVTPGRLRAQSRVPLVNTAEAQKYPMKLRVVERPPSGTASSFHNDGDSDDESTSAGCASSRLENPSDEEDRSSPSNNNLSDDELFEEEFNYDFAQHHREIALEYHQKRRAICADAAKTMDAHTLGDHGTANRQSPLSRFRADRMATAYGRSHGPESTLIGQSATPASRQEALQSSVRLGRLENEQLVGGESGESGSEDETVREVIQMLRCGDVQNIGPDVKSSSMSTILPTPQPGAVELQSTRASTSANRAKPSMFKMARGGRATESTTLQADSSYSHPANSSIIERKVPRSSPGQQFPVNKPTLRALVKPSELASPAIICPPSFP